MIAIIVGPHFGTIKNTFDFLFSVDSRKFSHYLEKHRNTNSLFI